MFCFLAGIAVYGQCNGEYIPGFIYIGEYEGNNYYCSAHNNYTWAQADAACQAAGGYIVVINDADENEFVRSSIMADNAWIGYSDQNSEGNFEWFGDNSTYTNWQAGEPNNYGGNEDFARLRKHSGQWTDRSQYHQFEFVMEVPCGGGGDPGPVDPPVTGCTVTCPPSDTIFVACDSTIVTAMDTIIIMDTIIVLGNPVVVMEETVVMTFGGIVVDLPEPTVSCDSGAPATCEEEYIPGFIYIGEHNGSNYYCSAHNSYTWQESNTLAQQNGGHLVVINDQDENDFIQNAIMASSAWIGFTDEFSEDNFTWVNGDAVNYTNWQDGQPNNLNNIEHYTRIKKYSGEWTDRKNNVYYEFVMEVPCDGGTAPSGGNLTQISGPALGDTLAESTNTEVVYEFVDDNGDVTTCSYIISVESCGGTSGNRVANDLVSGDCGSSDICLVKATPNPTTDFVTLSYVSDYNMEAAITLYSAIGEPVSEMRTQATKGMNNQIVDLSEFPTGLYYLNVQMRGESKSVKVFKGK